MSATDELPRVPNRRLQYAKYIAGSAVTFGSLFFLFFGYVVTGDAAGKIVGLAMGVPFGALFGWWAAARYHVERADFPRVEPERFEDDLEEALSMLGYELQSKRAGVWRFRPRFRAGILARPLLVRTRDDQVSMIGPSGVVSALLPIEYQDRELDAFN